MDKELRETTNLCVEVMNSNRQVKGKLGQVSNSRLLFDVNVMLNLSYILLNRWRQMWYNVQISIINLLLSSSANDLTCLSTSVNISIK